MLYSSKELTIITLNVNGPQAEFIETVVRPHTHTHTQAPSFFTLSTTVTTISRANKPLGGEWIGDCSGIALETWGNLQTIGKILEKNLSRADVRPSLRHGFGAPGGADTELDRAEVALQTSKRKRCGSVYLQLTHWCQGAVVVSIHFSSHIEFTCEWNVGHPTCSGSWQQSSYPHYHMANNKEATVELCASITTTIGARDLNKISLKFVKPKFYQHVNIGLARATEDATILHLRTVWPGEENPRVLFSSAFITIPPQHLVEGMKLLGVQTGTCNWIPNFLTQWQQAVRVGSQFPRTISGSTGLSQCCVPSSNNHPWCCCG